VKNHSKRESSMICSMRILLKLLYSCMQ